MIFIRLKTSSQMVNRVERNERESYTAPRRGVSGRWAPNPGPRDSRAPRDSGPPVLDGSSWPSLPRQHYRHSLNWQNPPGPPHSGLADLPPPPARWEGLGRRGPLCRRPPSSPRGPGATKARPAAPAPGLPFQFSPDLRWN